MAGDENYDRRAKEHLGFSRWWLIVAAILAMAAISPYQYVWSSIEGPLAEDLGVPFPQLSIVFTLFVVLQAGSQFPVGWWRDEHGPRALTFLAAILAGGGYFLLSYASNVWHLYILYSLGAIGVGIVYTVAVNTAIKWFPDRTGLTTGLGTMAFAGGAALVVPYVRANATITAYGNVLRTMGIGISLCILVAALILRDPPESWFERAANNDSTTSSSSSHDIGPKAMLKTWQFWLMYGMFVAVSGAGLMLTAKIVSFAQGMQLTAVTATLSATLLPVAGGAGRLIMGELSDRMSRRIAMATSFCLCGLGLLAVVELSQRGSTVGFLLSVIVATFFWSPQYTLFPSLVADYYGERQSSANYALLYSGKMWGGIFGGAVTGWLVTIVGWSATFQLGAVLALASGVAALGLRPPSLETDSTSTRTVAPSED